MDLTDEQWAILEPLIPQEERHPSGRRGRPWRDSREVLNGVQGIEMTAPHRRNRRKPRTQDGRKLRRYLRCWKVERLFAWLGNFRRLPVRYERHLANYLGLVQLACVAILLRHCL